MPDDGNIGQTASGGEAPAQAGPSSAPSQAPAQTQPSAPASADPGQAGRTAQGGQTGPEEGSAAWWHSKFSREQQETERLRSQLAGTGEEEETETETPAQPAAAPAPAPMPAPVAPAPAPIVATAAPAQAGPPATFEAVDTTAEAWVNQQAVGAYNRRRQDLQSWVGSTPPNWTEPMTRETVEAILAKEQEQGKFKAPFQAEADRWRTDQYRRLAHEAAAPKAAQAPQPKYVTADQVMAISRRTQTIARNVDNAMNYAARRFDAELLDGTIQLDGVPMTRRDAIREIISRAAEANPRDRRSYDPDLALFAVDRPAYNTQVAMRLVREQTEERRRREAAANPSAAGGAIPIRGNMTVVDAVNQAAGLQTGGPVFVK